MENLTLSSQENYLDPATISKISSLELIARRVVEGFIGGLHKSPYQGFNVEFSEHRPYNPGDDIRHIDWKALAKLDRYYVKKFEEETNLKAYIIVDSSGSMGFRSGSPVSKMDYARFLCVSLAYLMLRQRDSVGLCLFGDGTRRFVPPRSTGGHLQVLIDEIRTAKPEGSTRISEAVSDVAARISRRGLVIVISDLLGDQEEILTALRNMKHRRNEVILIQVLDPHEIDIPWRGYIRLKDMEESDVVSTDPSWLLKEYKTRVKEFIDRYRQGCVEEGIDYLLMGTDQPLDVGLATYLARRMKRTRG
jgi:uncharacterized protein (DUF58 family)